MHLANKQVKFIETCYKLYENVASYHYICGMGNNVITLFNRLVDLEPVDSITVNGVVYTF